MQKRNVSFTERCKEGSQKAFVKIGHSAAGNVLGDDNNRRNAPVVPFSLIMVWSYEKKMPRRKSK